MKTKPSKSKNPPNYPPADISSLQSSTSSSSSFLTNLGLLEEEEEELCREESYIGRYLGVFSDLEGFVSKFTWISNLAHFDDTHMQGYKKHRLVHVCVL